MNCLCQSESALILYRYVNPQNEVELQHAKLLKLMYNYPVLLWLFYLNLCLVHCVKSVRIRSYFGPYFPAFELNTER